MVVDRRGDLVFLSGTRFSLSQPLSAAKRHSTALRAWERAAILVLLPQSAGLLPHRSSVPRWLAASAGECPGWRSALVNKVGDRPLGVRNKTKAYLRSCSP